MPKPLPEQSLLREVLDYKPETGKLTWLLPPRQSKVGVGDEFGSVTSLRSTNSTKKYRMGMFFNVQYYSHRLIWMWMTGEDPGDKVVDHINGKGLDNRWENLRLLDRGQNIANQKGHKRRKSPYKGVYRQGSGWVAQLRRNKILYSSKVVPTSAEAKALYDEMVTRLDTL